MDIVDNENKNSHNKYVMKKIKTHWIYGRLDLIGVQIGWAFYPITYKSNKYVVEFRLCNFQHIEDIRVICLIYEYNEEYTLFRKHRKKCVFKDDITTICLEHEIIDMRHISDDQLKKLLPDIMKVIFGYYEKYTKAREVDNAKSDGLYNWNGIV